MRREQHVLQRQQPVAGLDRFALEAVQGRARQAASGQRVVQRPVVDQPSPRRVDEVAARFHQRELRCPHHAPGLCVQPGVQRHDVGVLQQVLQGNQLQPLGGGDKRVVDQDPRAEALEGFEDQPADRTEADQPDGHLRKVRAGHVVAVEVAPPDPLPEVLVGQRNPLDDRQHEPDGELGHGRAVVAGRVEDGNAPAGRLGDVDVGRAGAGAPDQPELRRRVEDLFRDGAVVRQDDLGLAGAGGDLVLGPLELADLRVADERLDRPGGLDHLDVEAAIADAAAQRLSPHL